MRASGQMATEKDENGDTVLHYAAEGGSEEVIRNLVSFGAQIDARNGQGKTPLQVAEEAGQEKAAEVLRQLDANE